MTVSTDGNFGPISGGTVIGRAMPLFTDEAETATSSGARRCADMPRSAFLCSQPCCHSAACFPPSQRAKRAAVMKASDNAYAAYIDEAAQRFELPANWIRAVLQAESNGDPRAVSPAGAMG